LNQGIFGSGHSYKNWGTDNYSLYRLSAPAGSPALSSEARIHVFAHDGDRDGSIKITTGTVGYLEYGLKETSTTWHTDGTKTLNEKDYNRIWFDREYPQRRVSRRGEVISE
jgi:hypothetical protein